MELCLLLLIFALPAILLSLPMLIPSVRKRVQNKPAMRVIMLSVIMILSLGITSAVINGLGIIAADVFVKIPPMVLEPDGDYRYLTEEFSVKYQEHRSAVMAELLIREIIPPPLKRLCYTTEKDVCEVADLFPWGIGKKTSGQYLSGLLISSLFILPGGGLAWYFTRKKPIVHQEEADEKR